MKKTYKLGKNGKAGNPFCLSGNYRHILFSGLFIAFLFRGGSLWAQIHTHFGSYPACPTAITSSSCLTAQTLAEGPNCVQGVVFDEGECPGNLFHAWWYEFTPTTTGSYTFSTDNGAGNLLRDTWMRLFTGSCPSVPITSPCPTIREEDVGDCYSLAAQITDTLYAGTSYYLQVSAWTPGNFCINVVKNEKPLHDCIQGAISIDALLSSDLSGCSSFVVETHIYRAHDTASIFDNDDGPTETYVLNDPNNCNGDNPVTSPLYFDVWHIFTYNAATMSNRSLSVYPNNGCNFYNITLFYDDPAINNAFACDSIEGLTYMGCAVGDVNPLTCNNRGGQENTSKNSFSNHPRLDLSNLGLKNGGVYYIRVSQFNEIPGETPPSEGYYNLTAEVNKTGDIGSDGITSDPCPTTATINCGETYHCLSNAGMTGNIVECGYAGLDEPGLYNNSAIYAFDVEGHSLCGAAVTLEVSNISHIGVNGLGGTFFITNYCNGLVGYGLSSTFCESRKIIKGIMTPGKWYIIINGESGNLLSYDLQVNIDYFLASSILDDVPCFDLVPNSTNPFLFDTILVADCPDGPAPPPWFETTVGVSNQEVSENFKLNVNPVPSSGNVEISYLTINNAPTTIELYNIMGEKVYSKVVESKTGIENTHTIDISSFSPGTYMVNLLNNGERAYAKMIKMD